MDNSNSKNVSDLIIELQNIIKKHGDMPVMVQAQNEQRVEYVEACISTEKVHWDENIWSDEDTSDKPNINTNTMVTIIKEWSW